MESIKTLSKLLLVLLIGIVAIFPNIGIIEKNLMTIFIVPILLVMLIVYHAYSTKRLLENMTPLNQNREYYGFPPLGDDVPEHLNHNIIFLDVDGVFNCQLFYEERYKQLFPFDNIPYYRKVKNYLKKLVKSNKIDSREFYCNQMDIKRIEMFNQLCIDTNSVVVISASMRGGKTIEELQQIFNDCGGTFKIISKTERLGYERGIEISKWLKDNITEEKYGCKYHQFYRYAIIDDDSDMLLNQASHFFQTDNYSGLTPTTCYKIKRFLTHKTF